MEEMQPPQSVCINLAFQSIIDAALLDGNTLSL